MELKALILNCTLKPGPDASNTEMLANEVKTALESHDVVTEMVRVVDHNVKPGVSKDEGDGDEWPAIYQKILKADILIIATPTWLGQASSIAQRCIERLDAMISETDDQKRPIAYNKVGGVVVTGNEDGAHHIIATTAQALIDIGYTIPPQAWTYWNMGPGPGPNYSDTDHGHDWSKTTGQTAASNMVAVAKALRQSPIPPPPNA